MDSTGIIKKIILQEVRIILSEIKIGQVKERFKSKKFLKAWAKATDVPFEELVSNVEELGDVYDRAVSDAFLELIPDDINDNEKGESLNWIINLFIADKIRIDQLFGNQLKYYFRNALESFFHYKNLYPIKQLSKFSSLEDLDKMLEENKAKVEEYQAKKASKDWEAGTNVIYEDQEWKVLIPENKGAACYWGKGTDWCTAAPGLDYYNQYHSAEDPLIIFVNKDDPDERYQFNFGSGQYMDINDQSIKKDPIFERLLNLILPFSDKIPSMNSFLKKELSGLSSRFSTDSVNNILKQLGYDDFHEKLPEKIRTLDDWDNASNFEKEFILLHSEPSLFLNTVSLFSNNGYRFSRELMKIILKRIDNNQFKLLDVLELVIPSTNRFILKDMLYGVTSKLSVDEHTELIKFIKNKINQGIIENNAELPGLILPWNSNIEVLEYLFSDENYGNSFIDSLKLQLIKNIKPKISRLPAGDLLKNNEFKKIIELIKNSYNNPNEDDGLKIMYKGILEKFA